MVLKCPLVADAECLHMHLLGMLQSKVKLGFAPPF